MAAADISIEVFSAFGCNKCARARTLVERVLKELGKASVDISIIDVVEELDYAIELGVRATPSIAINGELIFTALPSENDLRERLGFAFNL
ncbi:MAG: thioredoxin family protein [Thiohalomonadales bacterium]